MNFQLNDEQQQLQDSVGRLLADHCSFEQRRAIVASADGRSAALYGRLAELGVTALLVPEAQGGFGGRLEDLLPVLQACGAALCTEPVLASAVLGATALRVAGGEPAARLLPGLAQGTTVVAWAHDEPGTRHADLWIETRAEKGPGGWTISGVKLPVISGPQAQHFVVSARIAGAADATQGCAFFVVDAGAAGLQRRDFRLVDDTPASELTFNATPAQALADPLSDPLSDPHDGAAFQRILTAVNAAGIAALCADMVGAAQAAYRLALDYLNVRKQFGRLIGENQALRHRAADMLVSLEMARSMAIAAAVAADRPEAEDSAADLLRAKLIVGRHARQVCQHAIQCHGGIGMTEEYAVGHCLRRVHVADHLFGDADAQARRLAALLA
ncbi:MAG: acyl-CoA dehydrogenase family protein [Proteobacteria bacterium]|nr:acyl-CoA dehydrogenase family protein [Pseudomonadota bacterium]